MAGDWLKWCRGLPDKVEVVKIASTLGRSKYEVACLLMDRVWAWLDDNVAEPDENGHAFVRLVAGQTRAHVDGLCGIEGFAEAMIGVGWLLATEQGSIFPNWGDHNGKSAKARALDQKRKRKYRQREKKAARFCPVGRGTEIVLETETDIPIEASASIGSGELQKSSPPAVLVFPIVGGDKEWALTDGKLAQYKVSFPDLDVLRHLREARQWCIDNPGKRKTARGMGKFCFGWLERAQNRGLGGGGSHANAVPLRCDAVAARNRRSAEHIERLSQPQREFLEDEA